MDEEKLKILIGSRIKQLRDYKNITQEQLCSIINLEQPSLSNIECGKSLPNLVNFVAIVEALGVSPNTILDFVKNYSDLELSDNLNQEIFKYIFKLPEDSKKIIFEILKNKI